MIHICSEQMCRSIRSVLSFTAVVQPQERPFHADFRNLPCLSGTWHASWELYWHQLSRDLPVCACQSPDQRRVSERSDGVRQTRRCHARQKPCPQVGSERMLGYRYRRQGGAALSFRQVLRDDERAHVLPPGTTPPRLRGALVRRSPQRREEGISPLLSRASP
jgi:hypothetical protein